MNRENQKKIKEQHEVLIETLNAYELTDTIRVYRKTGMTVEADMSQENFHKLVMKVNEIITEINKIVKKS